MFYILYYIILVYYTILLPLSKCKVVLDVLDEIIYSR